jgi:glycosyltransferase involved in cell wall biosynthesis
MLPSNTDKTIMIIGPIAPPPWGPAARNRIMLDILTEWGIKVNGVNTLDWKTHPFSLLAKMLIGALRGKRVILGVSGNGRKILLPLLGCLSVIWPIKIVFFPAGGGVIAKEIAAMPYLFRKIFIASCSRCFIIAVERNDIKLQLQTFGIQNITVLPNFKRRPSVLEGRRNYSGPVQILFLSRIRPPKGIETLFNALDILASKEISFVLNIYGIVDEEYKPTLQRWLSSRPYASYGGVLEYDKVISYISSNDIMVFPTLRESEGFPGVLVDAALAGLAVVASDVSCNLELIIPGHNGLLAKKDDPSDLAEKIEELIRNPSLRQAMAENNRIVGQGYDADYVLRKFWDELIKRGW